MSEQPWRIVDLDLADGPRAVEASEQPHLLVFWWSGIPLGIRALSSAELPFSAAQVAETAAPMIADQALARGLDGARWRAGVDAIVRDGPRLEEAARLDALGVLDAAARPTAANTSGLSVVICTRDRPQMLAKCLQSLALQASPPGQVVVVDNSRDGSARPVCEGRAGVSSVHEPRPGLSCARNAGIAAAKGEFIAFTDDDAELSASWTQDLVRAFDDPSVDAVTGLVLPAVLDTPAQRAFELELGGFTGRYFPLVFDSAFLAMTRDMGPQVWRIGAGANMAFRQKVFARFGVFDERLGAGASGCSEDSEFWYRVLAGGGTCLYEPRAVVRHHHREDWAGLRRQYRAYMRGHVSALVAQADRYGHSGNIRRIFRQLPMYFLRTALLAVQNLQGWRLRLLAEEFIGWALGLQYLMRPKWRRAGQLGPSPKREAAAATHAQMQRA